MRALIQGLNYAPDEIGIAKYTTELAEWLAERGWEVSVVTGMPYYPDWRVPARYAGWRYRRENRNGVSLLRCPLYVPVRPSGTRRLIHLGSYAVASAPVLMREALRLKPDVVLGIAPALTAAPATLAAARASGAAALLHVQDFELDVAFGLGLMSGALPRRVLGMTEHAILRGFDAVCAPSAAMTARLAAKGCDPGRVFEFRNWADTEAIRPDVSGAAFRNGWGCRPGDIVALYSGNLSEKQGASILVDAAALLREAPGVRLVICGEGPARDALARGVEGFSNVTLLPLQPKERLAELLCAADIHLLPQLAGAEDLVLPSKLSGMLSSGRPVVATVGPLSGIAQEIGDAGLIVPPGDAAALARGIRRLAADASLREMMGVESRKRAERSWAKSTILTGFEARLQVLAERAKRGEPSSSSDAAGLAPPAQDPDARREPSQRG